MIELQEVTSLSDKHVHSHDSTSRRLIISVFLNLFITAAEVVGGFLSGSLSLLSDALHNLTDSTALLISYFARRIARKERDSVFTYGYKRAEVVASVINVTVLLSVTILLLKEALEKLLSRYAINTELMLWVAIVGLAGNVITALILYSGSKENLNVRSAFLHIMSDALSSVAVIVGSLLIRSFGWWFVDPLITLAIVAYVVLESLHILREGLKIVMQAVPSGISVEEIKEAIESLDMVKDAHHIHIWSSDGKDLYVECHATITENVKSLDRCIDEIEEKLKSLGVKHVTVQLEEGRCSERENC